MRSRFAPILRLACLSLLLVACTMAWGQSSKIFQRMGPNPFYTAVHAVLTESLQDKMVEVRVSNVIGKTVYTYQGSGANLDADLANSSAAWPRGNYFLQIKIPATGQTEGVRIQKQ